MATRRKYRLEPAYAVGIDAALGDFGVLVEPASVVAKVGARAVHFLQNGSVPPRTALITGAGPIGLLAALATTQYGLDTYVVDIVDSGPKPDLVRELGATYHSGPARDLGISPEVVIECTGIGRWSGRRDKSRRQAASSASPAYRRPRPWRRST